ncbi:putative 50 kda protein in type i retrotransposable element r1dm [Lasius niger]|uniref:Putative 50 kDa protein in type i retrotransposable element r1dm n=1 Tax=Lasius niger TaxID=67767 RepID=A0A0J7KM24_LASNI|nr:putative 50 kda protein in type i retrotransposable element r1dm [Lasius niger]
MTTAYIQVLASMHTMSSIKDMMHEEIGKACSNFLKSTGARDRSTELIDVTRASYANIASKDTTDKMRVPRGPSVKIEKTINIVIGPTDNAVGKYTSSQDTKDVVLKAIEPCKVGLKVSRLTKIRKLKTSPGLRKAGLEIKDEVKLNPWIIIHNIPAELTEDEMKGQLAKQNEEGTEKDIKVIYRYLLHPGKQYSSCVLEVRPETRQKFVSMEQVFLGWSTCRVADHVKVLQCYKCLSFGHLVKNCTNDAHCGHCSENHETRQCNNRNKTLNCFNCKSAKESNQSYTAFDVNKCSILKRKITAKIRLINVSCTAKLNSKACRVERNLNGMNKNEKRARLIV